MKIELCTNPHVLEGHSDIGQDLQPWLEDIDGVEKVIWDIRDKNNFIVIIKPWHKRDKVVAAIKKLSAATAM